MTPLPTMFYLQPIDDFHKLPLGTEFDVVYGPEITTGDGWRLIHFKTVDVYRPQKKDWVRAVEQRSKTPISEIDAERLWAQCAAPLQETQP